MGTHDMRTQPTSIREYPLGIVGGNKYGRYPKISSEETFNMIVTDNSPQKALVSYPGHKKIATILENGKGRALFTSVPAKQMFAVIEDTIFEINADGSFEANAQLETNEGPVYIAQNQKQQLAFCDGLKIYIWDYLNNSFTRLDNLDFRPTYITYQDGYFIAAAGITSSPNFINQTNTWRLSDLANATNWPDSAANVGELESKPDITQATVAFLNQLFVFGQTTTEIWYNTAAQLFTYQRSTYRLDYGVANAETIAIGSIALPDDQFLPIIIWLAINEKAGPTIMYSSGGQISQISTDGINFQLDALKNPMDSWGFIFRNSGHTFYQLTFRSDNLTLLYDFNTHLFFTITDPNQNYHPARKIAFFNNKYYFVSANDGNLYQSSDDYTTYDGETIPRMRIPPPFRAPNNLPFRGNYINVGIEQGNSKNEQRIDLTLSKDGGESYSNTVSKTLNQIGNRQNMCRFRNLGRANDLRMQFRFWSEDRFVILDNSVIGVYQ